jgi:thiamine pyrophosphokinase
MKSRGVCIIIGAAEPLPPKMRLQKDDYLIAVDGGYAITQQRNLKADAVVGDFDSLGRIPQHPNVITAPAEKDDTDMMMAIKLGLEKGYRVFHIYGGAGGRFDHTIANMQLLVYLSKRGARGFLYTAHHVITAITDSVMQFDAGYRGYVSVLAADSEVTGVTLKGLKYPLHNATVTNEFPIGVSNEFLGIESSITVEKGTVFIIFENNKLGEEE